MTVYIVCVPNCWDGRQVAIPYSVQADSPLKAARKVFDLHPNLRETVNGEVSVLEAKAGRLDNYTNFYAPEKLGVTKKTTKSPWTITVANCPDNPSIYYVMCEDELGHRWASVNRYEFEVNAVYYAEVTRKTFALGGSPKGSLEWFPIAPKMSTSHEF